MKKKLFLFALILFGTLNGQAQKKGYSDGFVVTLQNDTIHGPIKSKSSSGSCTSVSILNKAGKKEKYFPNELILYSKARKTYRSFLLPENILGQRAFMLELVHGDVSLYIHYSTRQNSGMSMNGMPMYYGTSTVENYYLQKEGLKNLTRVRSLDFKSQISEYLNNDEKLAKMILNKEYRYDDIEEIVELYNKNIGT